MVQHEREAKDAHAAAQAMLNRAADALPPEDAHAMWVAEAEILTLKVHEKVLAHEATHLLWRLEDEHDVPKLSLTMLEDRVATERSKAANDAPLQLLAREPAVLGALTALAADEPSQGGGRGRGGGKEGILTTQPSTEGDGDEANDGGDRDGSSGARGDDGGRDDGDGRGAYGGRVLDALAELLSPRVPVAKTSQARSRRQPHVLRRLVDARPRHVRAALPAPLAQWAPAGSPAA